MGICVIAAGSKAVLCASTSLAMTEALLSPNARLADCKTARLLTSMTKVWFCGYS